MPTAKEFNIRLADRPGTLGKLVSIVRRSFGGHSYTSVYEQLGSGLSNWNPTELLPLRRQRKRACAPIDLCTIRRPEAAPLNSLPGNTC